MPVDGRYWDDLEMGDVTAIVLSVRAIRDEQQKQQNR